MEKSNFIELRGRVEYTDSLTELLLSGARQLLQQAVEAEVQEFWRRIRTGFWKTAESVWYAMATCPNG